MFGASVNELHLLIKSLINIGRTVDLCVITKKIHSVHRNCESGLAMIYKHAAHRLVHHMLQVVQVVSQEIWHPRKSGTPMQFFLGNLAPLQEKWNPHQTVGYLVPPPKNPRIFGTPCQKTLG